MVGLTITGYEYSYAVVTNGISGNFLPFTASSWTSGTSFTISGLTNGTLYKFKIRAVNPLGKGAESVETNAFKPNTVPSTPSAATLTAGDGTDTFTWVAPASNGSTITKYGYQVSTDNGSTWYSAIGGTLNGETETTDLSVALTTQYSTSTYKVRVRAFNDGTNGGWGDYSTISTDATVAWYKGDGNVNSYTSQTGYSYEECSAVGCSTCGTQARRKTVTREERKYRWYRSGSTAGPYDVNWTAYTQFPSFSTVSCADYGVCNTSGGTWTNINTTFDYASAFNATGVRWVSQTDRYGNTYVYDEYNQGGSCSPRDCPSGSTQWLKFAAYNLEQCSSTGNYRSSYVGCAEYVQCGSGGGGS
jgi:hypothetical protein